MGPKNPATIDWESFYDDKISVAEQGVGNYVRDTYGYLVAIKTNEFEFVGEPQDVEKTVGLRWMDDHDPVAFNSNFDQAFWEQYFPAFKKDWYCVSDACAVNQVPRNLANASAVVLQEHKSKEARDSMKGVHWKDLSEERQTYMADYALDDAVREHRLIDKVPMSDFEAEVAALTRKMNRRGVVIDMDLLDRSVDALEDAKFGALKKIPWRTERAILSPKALPEFCQSLGLACPTSRDRKNATFTSFIDANPAVKEVVEAMRMYDTANKRIRKMEDIRLRVRDDGRMPLELLYCGAPHTRRWSSRGVNIQNLEREPLDLTEWVEAQADTLLSVWMRNLIVPAPGKKILALDAAQIEPRCLAWLVSDEDLLTAVRAGFPVYEAYARAKLKWTGGVLKKEDPAFYQRTKNNFLGSGYGMGGKKIFATNPGTFKDLAEAIATVQKYRQDNPKVVAYWKFFDDLIRKTVVNLKDQTLELTMPTGESLKHFFVRPFSGAFGKSGYHSYKVKGDFSENSHIIGLWGGLATENVTQRMARDVIAVAKLRIDKAGIGDILFSSHDEIVIEVDADNAEEAYKEAEHIMTISPDWAPDLPLGSEGKILDRYTKI